MSRREASLTHLLLSIAVSHYNEKARWAFAYYQVPYKHQLLLPWLHMLTVRPIVDAKVCAHPPKDTMSSPFSTPCLAVYDASGSKLQESFHDSHDILVYLSENFSDADHANLYTSCGPAKVNEIHALEKTYDENLGRAACNFFYVDMLTLNKWHSMIPFALMGFRNRVGLLQSLIWFALSPVLGRMLMSVTNMEPSGYQEAMQTCRENFRHASKRGSFLF